MKDRLCLYAEVMKEKESSGGSLGVAAEEAAKTGKISSVASGEHASRDAKEAQVTYSFTTLTLLSINEANIERLEWENSMGYFR